MKMNGAAAFVTAILGLFSAIGLGLLGFGLWNAWRSSRAAGWPIASGTITHLDLHTTARQSPRSMFEVAVTYRYEVDGVAHEGSRIAFGYSGSSELQVNEAIRRKLAGAETIAVRYDPADPSSSCLAFGVHYSIRAILIFACVWLVFTAGFAAMLWLMTHPDDVILDSLTILKPTPEGTSSF